MSIFLTWNLMVFILASISMSELIWACSFSDLKITTKQMASPVSEDNGRRLNKWFLVETICYWNVPFLVTNFILFTIAHFMMKDYEILWMSEYRVYFFPTLSSQSSENVISPCQLIDWYSYMIDNHSTMISWHYIGTPFQHHLPVFRSLLLQHSNNSLPHSSDWLYPNNIWISAQLSLFSMEII